MAGPFLYNRVWDTSTTTGTGTLTLSGTPKTGYQAFSVVGDGNTCFYTIEAVDANGVPTGDWEEGIGTYTTSGTTLARTTVLRSSNSNAAVNFGAGTKNVFVCTPAEVDTGSQPTEISVPTLADLLRANNAPNIPAWSSWTRGLGQLNSTCQGRLTLSSGNAVYSPNNFAIPVSTDTTAETVTFTLAHGWTVATMVTVSATVGGLTAGTTYYVNIVSGTVVSFHTTVADAIAGTNKVNLTANITSYVIPLGVANTSVYFTPYGGQCIAIYDGTRWRMYTFTELTLVLGTLTASLPYDLFIYDNSGTLTLEALAWTSTTVRATALVQQNGVWCKTGALTRRYLGTFYTTSTTTTEDSTLRRDLWNCYNRVKLPLFKQELTSSWTYALVAWRQVNASAANQIECVVGLAESPIDLIASILCNCNSAASGTYYVGIGRDSTTVPVLNSFINAGGMNFNTNDAAARTTQASCFVREIVPLGFHTYTWLETDTTTAAVTGNGQSAFATPMARQSGLSGDIFA